MTTLPEKQFNSTWGVLPIRIRLSFHKVFEYWENQAASGELGKSSHAKEVLTYLEAYPELRAPIDDHAILERLKAPIKVLLSPIFPEILQQNEIKAAGLPFTNMNFNRTLRFADIIAAAGEGFSLAIRDVDHDLMYRYACIFVLNVKYQANIDNKRPYLVDIPDVKRGIVKHYRVFFNGDFSSFRLRDEKFSITEKDIQLLKDNFNNISLWKEKIPPNTFDFEGLGIMTIFDVSSDEVVSALKDDFLRPDALHSKEMLETIQHKMRTIFNIPDLCFGFTFLDEEEGMLNKLDQKFSSSLILGDLQEINMRECMCDDTQTALCTKDDQLIIPDLESMMNIKGNPMFQSLLKRGIKSYLISPIKANGKTIGAFELGATQPNELNSLLSNKLHDILPIFTVAMQRGMEDYKTKLEAIVQENFTAIHPSVSWRFFDAAEDLLKARKEGREEEIEEIVFEEVYPLYGQSDIKGSSTERNKAIQADLITQLRLAKKVLIEAAKLEDLPIYQQLIFRMKECTIGVKKGLNAGDEVSILEFLKTEIYPVFNHLHTVNPALRKLVDDYMAKLDPELGVVYDKRKDYEQSVATINDKIAAYIDLQQENAQQMFPHYYEKYKTDGVEYNIYVGGAMVKSRAFDHMHLHNLRLWQLLTMCGVENKMHQLKPHLSVPLDVATLILVHSSPLTIKFRMAEKRFDVDGAYNVRYEIVKKRIDKALVKGRNERLTQPGKIAIVYSQEKDAVEYIKYLEYLQSLNKIGPVIEKLELAELQGASGLKALRVDVVYDDSQVIECVTDGAVEEKVSELK
ncbi:MAG: GAF domain-containing protein [Bacteroidota bacterium]